RPRGCGGTTCEATTSGSGGRPPSPGTSCSSSSATTATPPTMSEWSRTPTPPTSTRSSRGMSPETAPGSSRSASTPGPPAWWPSTGRSGAHCELSELSRTSPGGHTRRSSRLRLCRRSGGDDVALPRPEQDGYEHEGEQGAAQCEGLVAARRQNQSG